MFPNFFGYIFIHAIHPCIWISHRNIVILRDLTARHISILLTRRSLEFAIVYIAKIEDKKRDDLNDHLSSEKTYKNTIFTLRASGRQGRAQQPYHQEGRISIWCISSSHRTRPSNCLSTSWWRCTCPDHSSRSRLLWHRIPASRPYPDHWCSFLLQMFP